MTNKVENYSRFFSKEALRSTDVFLRKIGELAVSATEDTIILGGGMPNPKSFPFVESTMTIEDGTVLKISGKKMKQALQYSFSKGYEPLITHLESLTQFLHGPFEYEHSIQTVFGTQHGLSLAADILLNENDYIIVPDPLYSTMLNIFETRDPRYLSIACDAEGMIPEELRKALSKWDPAKCRNQYSNIPKIMYLNPIGNNPCGSTMSTKRKQDIYDIASEYNILILEDDPYFYFSFLETNGFPTSFLKIDVDGRVIRMDSFSKVLSGGIRLGYLTGPKELIQRIGYKITTSVIHVPCIIQMYVSGLFDTWGQEKFLEHTKKIREFYRSQRDLMVKAAEKNLTGLCEWDMPQGGLFMWLKVIGVEDTWTMACERGLENNIILAPGSAFFPGNKASNFIRLSFSLATEEQFNKGIENIARLITTERQIAETRGKKI